MATSEYMSGRKRYARPQGILWSENPGTIIDGLYVPTGDEIDSADNPDNSFLILSDHNRSEMNFQPERIENRQRMINGRMRSYHVADKQTMSVSWSLLPSRAYSNTAAFSANGIATTSELTEYTADGGAGGVELLGWYQNHKGSFWMFLAYDKYNNFTEDKYDRLDQYNDVIEVFISSFDYSVAKRGRDNHDLWNISVTLEEA